MTRIAALLMLFTVAVAAQPLPDPVPIPVAPDPTLADQDPNAEDEATPEADTENEAEADTEAEPEADDAEEADEAEEEEEAEEDLLPEANRPRMSVEISPREGLVTGDVFTLTLRADALKDDDLAVPREQDFSPFDVLDRRSRVEEGRDRAVHFFELDLLALEPGEHSIPAIRLRVVTGDGVVGEVSSEPQTVQIGSVLGNEPDAQPRAASAPIQVWEDDYTLVWLAVGLGIVLLTALITLLLARWWRRRQREAAPPPPPRPPWELALKKLEALRRDRVAAVEEERIVGWVDGVSDAVREYLGHRYEFDGLESTTDEIVTELRGRKLIGISNEEVAAFLGDCDLIKFAKATFDGDQCDTLLGAGVRIVRTTTPRPDAVMQPVAAPQPAAPTSPVVVPLPSPAPLRADHPDAKWMPKDEIAPLDAPAEPEVEAAPFMPVAQPPETRPIPQTMPPAAASEGPAESRPIPQTLPPARGADTLPEERFEIPTQPDGAKPDTMIEPAPTLPTGAKPPEGGS